MFVEFHRDDVVGMPTFLADQLHAQTPASASGADHRCTRATYLLAQSVGVQFICLSDENGVDVNAQDGAHPELFGKRNGEVPRVTANIEALGTLEPCTLHDTQSGVLPNFAFRVRFVVASESIAVVSVP